MPASASAPFGTCSMTVLRSALRDALIAGSGRYGHAPLHNDGHPGRESDCLNNMRAKKARSQRTVAAEKCKFMLAEPHDRLTRIRGQSILV